MGGCCSRRTAPNPTVLGYRVTLPDGTIYPPIGTAPLLSRQEAKDVVSRAGGGTAYAEVRQS